MTWVPPSSAAHGRISRPRAVYRDRSERTSTKYVIILREPPGVPRAQEPLGNPRDREV